MVLDRTEVQRIAAGYRGEPVVASIGSHSALDICDGAATEGFRTLVLAQKGRDRTYSQYYRARRDAQGQLVRGCVDDVWTYDRFDEIARPDQQERLRAAGALLVPNRALSSYVAY